jgi:hypothetical protein
MNRLLLLICVLAGAIFAEEPPKKMTKIEVVLQSPDAPAGSFAAKPKMFYRAGNRYCRVEEAPDPDQGIHGLMIINEPDWWMVNLFSKTARHGVDPGPTFNCRQVIFANGTPQSLDDESKQIMQLEFGRELEFFKGRGGDPEERSRPSDKRNDGIHGNSWHHDVSPLHVWDAGAPTCGVTAAQWQERYLLVQRIRRDGFRP